jgi:L-ascorbate metabolism protein UlaG (beta-lactamase superfamily)
MIAPSLLLVVALALTACSSAPPGLFSTPEPPDGRPHVELHYLGNGGWLFRRGGDVIATAPFVTNPPWYALLFPGDPDETLIEEVIPRMDGVEIVLVGHGHYDHAMDLPYIATRKAPAAKLYGGQTVVNTLWAVPALQERLRAIETEDAAIADRPGKWIPSRTSPIRVMPLRSTHAPHFAGLKLIPWWSVDEKQTRLPWSPYWWKEGETFAFVIDFMRAPDYGEVEFRIYYQDAASRPGTGIVPVFEGADAARVDAAILCVAAFDQVDGNPEHILANVRPRYVVGGHWEDFFSRSFKDRPLRPAVGTSLEDLRIGMKRLASRLTWWHRLPHTSTPRSTPQEGRGQPWTILASTSTRGTARFTSLPRGVRSSSSGSAPRASASPPCSGPGPAPGC